MFRISFINQVNGGDHGPAIQSRSLEVMDDKVISEALKNTFITMAFTMLFGVGVLLWKGKKSAIEFLVTFHITYAHYIQYIHFSNQNYVNVIFANFQIGFLVEKSLSVDNLFVFLMLFDYFKVPFVLQGKVMYTCMYVCMYVCY